MSGSVGEIKLPIVSTFDPAGTAAAKAAMKDLEQAGRSQGGGGGGGGARAPAAGGSGASNAFAKMPGMEQLKGLTSEMGLGNPMEMLSKFATPMAGAAAAATGLFVAFHKGAQEAREIRIESQKLGTTVGFYRDLTANARLAGISLGDVTAGMEKVNGKAQEAMTGGIGAQAYFAGLGVSPDQLARMQGDPAAMAKIVAQRGNTAQQIQMFGSVDAAQALAKTSGDNGHARAAGDALEAVIPSWMNHPVDAMKEAGRSFLSEIAFGAQRAGRAYGGGMSFEQAEIEMNKEAADKEGKETLDRTITARKEAGTKRGVSLLNTAETNAAEAKSESTYNYSDLSALTGISGDTFRARAETQRMQKQQAFDSQYQNSYERNNAQRAIIDRQTQEGTLTPVQGYRAALANFDQTAAAISGTRSNAVNVRNQMTSFGLHYNDPGADKGIAEKEARVKEAQTDYENAHYYGSEYKPSAAADRKKTEEALAAAKAGLADAQGDKKSAQDDAARKFGDELTNYVQGMTSAGAQAGAYGVNTVQGASQLMGAEYQMDQSQNTTRMVELLLKIAENTGHITKDQKDAVTDSLGYRTRDPISGIFGN